MASIDDGDSTCVLLIASCSEVAHAVETIATEVQRRIFASPTLGDFITVRFVDIGSAKAQDGDHGATAAKAIMRSISMSGDSGLYYLVVAVVDDSATQVETVLRSFVDMADAMALDVRVHGFAVRSSSESAGGVRIPISAGIAPSELVGSIRRFADYVAQSIAASAEPGIPVSELDRVHNTFQPQTLGELAGAASPVLAQADASADAAARETEGRRWKRRRAARPIAHSEEEALSKPGGTQPSTHTPAGSIPTTRATRTANVAPVVGLFWASPQMGQTKTWNQFVSFAIEIDRGLRNNRWGWRYLSRYLTGNESRGSLFWAGQLAPEQLTRPAERYAEPGPQLDALRFALDGDASFARSNSSTNPVPIVLMLTAEAPLSGAAVLALYENIRSKARVIWIVTPDVERLLSTAFTGGAEMVVLQHDAVDRVLRAIHEAQLGWQGSDSSGSRAPHGGLQ